jgi:hypothetical protein
VEASPAHGRVIGIEVRVVRDVIVVVVARHVALAPARRVQRLPDTVPRAGRCTVTETEPNAVGDELNRRPGTTRS